MITAGLPSGEAEMERRFCIERHWTVRVAPWLPAAGMVQSPRFKSGLRWLHAQGVGGEEGFDHERVLAGRDLEVARGAAEDLDELAQLLDQLGIILDDDPLAHRLLVRLQQPV